MVSLEKKESNSPRVSLLKAPRRESYFNAAMAGAALAERVAGDVEIPNDIKFVAVLGAVDALLAADAAYSRQFPGKHMLVDLISSALGRSYE